MDEALKKLVQRPHPPLTRQDKLAYGLIMSFLSCFLVAMISIWYAGHVADEAEARANANAARSYQAWCEVVNTLNAGYTEAPPVTPTGKKLAADVAELKIKLGC